MNQQDITSMLQDVRKAHRLLFQYQRCVLSIIKEIHKVYDFDQYPLARKRFSSPLGNKQQFYENKAAQKKKNSIDIKFQKNPDANLGIKDKWAWDFLYTYELEYYFGMKKTKEQRCLFSVFQVSDTGYYWQDGYQIKNNLGRASKTNPETFWDANESESYLIFVAEVSSDNKPKYFPGVKEHIVNIYGGEADCKILIADNNSTSALIAKRYPMVRFFDKDGVLDCINDFSSLVKEHTDFVLAKQNI